eukprot:CAMPEP_0183358900 /NCGR_PEP_ID=MMETSP0164_2-20130417/50695_1 /TAXON_ID=221442 /ORGANISM="Coccolithus pelagicus ssp braarudi, Strain PLY182g" /LENGTH=235 /DNA_ID=CAMNT_0025532901 /DNA_START=12 /DNA_END=716 /DNA_ORIENTATION=+
MRSAQAALRFASSSATAVVLTVWPSGTGELPAVHTWLESAAATIVHEQSVPLTSDLAELLLVLALYEGEDWLESNCWYFEQPLPAGPPEGPYPGAKWKRELCFRNAASRAPYIFVLDVGARRTLWQDKYALRARLARNSGNPGNSCIHLTDPQHTGVLVQQRDSARRGGGGMSCDDSYAFSCARALLHPASIEWLNGADVAALELGSQPFRVAWQRYVRWLSAATPDCSEGGEWL